jgi:HSP20 family molecular chaperone IbpA
MSILDLEKLNARQMETMHRKHSREISRIEQGHDKLKDEVHASNANDLVEIRHENMNHIVNENAKKEKVLEKMKLQLDQTTKMTDKQIQDLRQNTDKVKQTEFEKVNANREIVKAENELYLEDLGHRLSSEQKKIVESNQDQLQYLKSAKGQELAETEGRLQTKINNKNNEFSQKFQADDIKHKLIKDDQDKTYKKERMNTHIRQEQDTEKLTSSHSKTLETREKTFRKGIKEQDLIFEKKYTDSLNAKTKDLKGLDDLNDKVLTKMKGDLKDTLQASVNRSDDPFYRFTELKPTLKQFEDRVEISVAIPEHAKTDVQLTMHGKEAIISFSRRYDDTRKEAGTSNVLHKVESFTTRLLTNHHLDSKSVKEKYNDGVMTYVIKGS